MHAICTCLFPIFTDYGQKYTIECPQLCTYTWQFRNRITTLNAYFKILRIKFYNHKQYSCNFFVSLSSLNYIGKCQISFIVYYLGVPCNYPQGSYDRYSDPSTRQCRCRVSIVIIPWCCNNDKIFSVWSRYTNVHIYIFQIRKVTLVTSAKLTDQ